MRNKKVTIVMLFMVIFFILNGCSQDRQENRQVIKKPNKTITVIDNPDDLASKDRISVQKIDRYENIDCMDWINENILLITKDNKDLNKIMVEGEHSYPRNLYLFNIETAEDKLLFSDSAFYGFAAFSPDNRYIYYKKHIEETATGFIMDSKEKRRIRITDNGLIGVSGGRWIDKERILYPAVDGGIYIGDITGRRTKIAKADTPYLKDAVKLGDKLYYTTYEGKMMGIDIVTREKILLQDNIIHIFPSPNKNQIAVVKNTDKTKQVLMLTDLQGREKKIIAEGSQIHGTAWSQDGRMLAYSILANDGSDRGLYISNLNNNKRTHLSVDTQVIRGPIRWSPSGRKIAFSETIIDDNNSYKPVTYIINLWKKDAEQQKKDIQDIEKEYWGIFTEENREQSEENENIQRIKAKIIFNLKNIPEFKEKWSKGEDFTDLIKGSKQARLMGLSSMSKNSPHEITASSNLQEKSGIVHEPYYAHDLNLRTAWVEAAEGKGPLEYIEYRFKAFDPNIDRIRILNGYIKSEKLWKSNTRIKTLKLFVNDKPYAILELKDTPSLQEFSINPLQSTAKKEDLVLKFEILEVYDGDKYEDAAITELFFMGSDN